MQTFLPCDTFGRSAAALDSRRLGKQRVETLQILRALIWPEYGWKNHPAVVMWRGFTPALVAYGVAVCDEWRRRGHRDGMRAVLLDYNGGREVSWSWCLKEGLLPPWLGDEDLHRSHQSSLLRKDPDFYRPLFPGVPDDLDYVWPTPVFPLEVPETTGLIACRLDLPPLPDEHLPPAPPLDHRPGPSVARVPTEADLDAMRAEADDPRQVRFFRRGQRLPAPTSRFTLRLNFSEKSSAAVSIPRGPRSTPW
ncbi:MSMEG_6728 family protein [Saccharothrix sp. HUAS TT1]|uniref:MSMEG_6728 family protein n=1 Tax=unclassified Saccharothrix TaxID=2593673 RepID=UPI00345BEC39